ncbi:MAG: diguanylate cyclase [Ilumatobacteraceae bacterium]|nr:diguanylate cyclase [Ilumatobacteraceae bacterium]
MRESQAASGLAEALRPGGVRADYQPLVDLETGQVLGYEALGRGPAGSPLSSPLDLLAAARPAGLLSEIDWAFRAAALRGALDADLGNGCTLFVNVEPDVAVGAPPEHAALLERAGAELRIVLEVTERAVISRPAELLRLVDWARDQSWGIALDDVGTNPLCLALMPFLEPDVIKLDLRIVQGRPTSEVGLIVSAVMAEAERSGATVVAEGIETEEHRQAALALGAVVGQGWLFAHPGPLPAPVQAAADTIPLLRVPGTPSEQTPFSVVRSARPMRRADKRLLLGIAMYLEEQATAWHDGPVILSTFEHQDEIDVATLKRYECLSGQGSLVIALGAGMAKEPAKGVVGAEIPLEHRLCREWSVVVVGPHYAGALVARQRTAAHDDWDFAVTHDRSLVVAAGRALLRHVAPDEQRLDEFNTSDPAG